MDPFAQAVANWHDFYLMIGTAAATLIGLLFLSLSLNVDVITRPERADLRSLAAHTFGNFMSVLMFSVLFLIPSQVPAGLGVPLLCIGGFGLYNTIAHWREARGRPSPSWLRGGGVARRFYLPTFCYTALITIAGLLLFAWTDGLYWLVPVMLMLIVSASRNAWDLLMALRSQPKDA
jgi:hypothetical protein